MTTLQAIQAGHKVVVSISFLDQLIDLDSVNGTDIVDQIATALNKRRCGIHDVYVAWIGDKPTDLEYDAEMYASTAQGVYMSEINRKYAVPRDLLPPANA